MDVTVPLRQPVNVFHGMNVRKIIGEELHEQVTEEMELVEMAGDEFTDEEFLDGKLSPVFWGSAMNNFGVEPLLRFLTEKAAPPSPRNTIDGLSISPNEERFSGFIFKIQANMNPKHRDRIAFMRVVSGAFERDMTVIIGRNGDKLKLAKPHSFMAQERSIVDHASLGTS